MSKQDFYRKWAMSYSHEADLKKKLEAVVFVEGKDDKPFWEAVFMHASKQVRVITGVDNPENPASGKQERLKYFPHLNKRFFICIDSDYGYIKQAHPEYNAQNFVLQTYTYAIENHYLASNGKLQDFLKQHSSIIYGAFLAHLAAGTSVNKFCESVKPPDGRNESLDALQKNIREKQLPCVDNRCMDNRYAALGLAADNVYLFMKAKMLMQPLRCGNDLSFEHFPMDKIQKDIAAILT
ncbi:MAG: DUF4435 domain-containing protein [Prevotellaceae bacterium]|nr:DUF4435 domain-containing protein [Prevotellaceae bacterium]